MVSTKTHTHIGWQCNACGGEVREVTQSLGSAGGGSIGSTSFEHIIKGQCHHQVATVARIKGRAT